MEDTITINHMHFTGWQADMGLLGIVALLMAIGFILGRMSK